MASQLVSFPRIGDAPAGSSQRTNTAEQGGSLLVGLDAQPLEALAETNVCVEARRIVVEVQERLRFAIEDARPALHEPCDRAQLAEERPESIEALLVGVLHVRQHRYMSVLASTRSVRRLDLGYFVRPAVETGTGAPRIEPVHGYVVSHPTTTILFDTGMGAVDLETENHYQPVRRPLPEALANAGAGEVDVVVNSHLHFDHCGANHLFPGRPIVVQSVELETARAGNYTVPELVDFAGVSYEQLDGEAELAEGVFVVPTPGHSPGHQSLVVRCADGTVVVAGQATDFAFEYGSHHLAYLASGLLGRQVAPYPTWVETLERFDPARVVFAHDSATWERGP